MPIISIKEEKKQQIMIVVFFMVLLVTFIVLWETFFKKPVQSFVLPSQEYREPRINFDSIEGATFKGLKNFEAINPFGKKPGRENPFIEF